MPECPMILYLSVAAQHDWPNKISHIQSSLLLMAILKGKLNLERYACVSTTHVSWSTVALTHRQRVPRCSSGFCLCSHYIIRTHSRNELLDMELQFEYFVQNLCLLRAHGFMKLSVDDPSKVLRDSEWMLSWHADQDSMLKKRILHKLWTAKCRVLCVHPPLGSMVATADTLKTMEAVEATTRSSGTTLTLPEIAAHLL